MMMSRFEATQQLLSMLDKEPIVSSLGPTTFDLFGAGDRPQNFYLWGGMGMASSVALGLAEALETSKVIALEGDGALLMNLGSLTTISVVKPENLVLVVWDNGKYEATGGQITHTGRGVDLESVAQAAGIENTALVSDLDALSATLQQALETAGPWLVVAKVVGDGVKRSVPRTPVYLKERFSKAMGALRD